MPEKKLKPEQKKRLSKNFPEMTPEEEELLAGFEERYGAWTPFASQKDGSEYTKEEANELANRPDPSFLGLVKEAVSGVSETISQALPDLDVYSTGELLELFQEIKTRLDTELESFSGEAEAKPAKEESPSAIGQVFEQVGQDNLYWLLARGKELGLDKVPGAEEIYDTLGGALDPYLEDDKLSMDAMSFRENLHSSALQPQREPMTYGSPNTTIVEKSPANDMEVSLPPSETGHPASMGIRG